MPPDAAPPAPVESGSAARQPLGSASLALAVLVALVVLSPWPFGSVHPRTTQAIVLVALGTSVASLAWAALAAARHPPAWPSPPHARWATACALGLWLFGVVQLIPLPHAVHQLVAPGSAAIWHPSVPAASTVLGGGPHPISLFPTATWRWLAFFAGAIALVSLSAPALRERRAVLRVASTVVASAIVLALFSFASRLWFGDRLFGTYESLVRPFGPFVSKNHFAGYVEMAALLAVGLATGLASENRTSPGPLGWLDGPRPHRVVIAWAAAAVLILAVPVSLSRGGVVSLTAGLVAFALLRLATKGPSAHADDESRSRRPLALGLVASLAAIALALAAFAFVLPEPARERIATIGGGDSSSAYRIGIWRDTLRLVAASPAVGSGFGAYADAVPRFKTGAGDVRVEHAESDVLELLAEGGLVGGALVAVALTLFAAAAWRGLRTTPHRLSRGVRIGSLAGLVALLLHSLLDFNLHIPSSALLAALLASFSLAPVTSARRASATAEEFPDEVQPEPTRSAHGRASGTLVSAALALVVVASLVVASTTPWRDERPWPSLSVQAGALRRSTTEREMAAHLQRRPAHAEAWLALAWVRASTSRAQATALGEYAVRLDPTHVRLAKAAKTISD
jgi:O-antigen ligase